MAFLRIMKIALVTGVVVCSSYFAGDAVSGRPRSNSAPTSKPPRLLTPEEEAATKARALGAWGGATPLIGGSDPGVVKTFCVEYADVDEIAQILCGGVSDELRDQIYLYLCRLLNTEAVRAAQGYALDEAMRVAAGANRTIRVTGRLTRADRDSIQVVIVFNARLRIVELEVAGVPLIGGVRTILRRYFEAKGINIMTLDPKKRVTESVAAIVDFLQQNPK
jgi:hypothetical protein